MKTLTLLLCLLMASCTTTQRVVGLGVVGLGAWALSQKGGEKKEKESKVIEVDLSGTMIGLGGAAISPREVVHVAHWHDVLPTVAVSFRAKNGAVVEAKISGMENLGNDLVVLTIDPPLDPAQHTIYPVGNPIAGNPLTVYRLEKPPFGTISDGTRDGFSYIRTTGEIEIGDSGKIHVQNIGGKIHVVSLTSTESGKGPHLAQLLRQWRNQPKITEEK